MFENTTVILLNAICNCKNIADDNVFTTLLPRPFHHILNRRLFVPNTHRYWIL